MNESTYRAWHTGRLGGLNDKEKNIIYGISSHNEYYHDWLQRVVYLEEKFMSLGSSKHSSSLD